MTTMPIPQGFYVSSPFGNRPGGYHWGTDFGKEGGSGGQPIYAVKRGTVAHSGPAVGFGQWITLDHDSSVGGGFTVYGHIVPYFKVGEIVEEGQKIGHINPDYYTNGGVAPHLHFEWHRFVWSNPGTNRLDPMLMLANAKYVGQTERDKEYEVNSCNWLKKLVGLM